MDISDYDLGWLAGIIEGEGNITVRLEQGRIRIHVQVQMTDEDVIISLRDKTGYGTVSGPYRQSENRKLIWVWAVNVRDDVSDVLYTILPFMHRRRSDVIVEAIEALESIRDLETYRQQFFICGHERTGDNTSGHNCKTCRTAQNRRYYLKNKTVKNL